MRPSAVDQRSAPVAASRTCSSTRPAWSISSATRPVRSSVTTCPWGEPSTVADHRVAPVPASTPTTPPCWVVRTATGPTRSRPARRCGRGRTGRRSSPASATRRCAVAAPRSRRPRRRARCRRRGDERLRVLHVDAPPGGAVGHADRGHRVGLDDERVVTVDEERGGVGEAVDTPPDGSGCTVRRGAGGRTAAASRRPSAGVDAAHAAARTARSRRRSGREEPTPAATDRATRAGRARAGAPRGGAGRGVDGPSMVMTEPPCLGVGGSGGRARRRAPAGPADRAVGPRRDRP